MYSTLETLASQYEDIIINGDFNSNLLTETDLTDNMLSLGLFPANVTSPTHYTSTSSTLIDLFFVSNTANINLYEQISASCFSKHDLLFLNYNFNFHEDSKVFSYRDFNSLAFNDLCEYSSHIPWHEIYFLPTVDEQLCFLERSIQHLFDLTVPIRHRKMKNSQKSWFSDSIKHAIQQRDLVYARWKRYKTLDLRLQYITARRDVNKLIKLAKTEYYSTRFSNAIDSRQTWNTIREIGIGKQISNFDIKVDGNMLNKTFTNTPVLQTDPSFYNFIPSTLGNGITGDFFRFSCISESDVMYTCSLIRSNAVGTDNIYPKFIKILMPLILPYVTYFLNNIITSSMFPSNWKHSKIIPLPKTSGEYRPIAILCFLSKVLEKILYRQMIMYINSHNMLSSTQSGFRESHSCVTALVEVSENIRQGLENGNINFLVLLDHSKAFDTVDHATLIGKLRHFFRFSNTSINLIASYLSNRTQSVFVNNAWSDSLSVVKGVPQGSILGPLLFSLYVNDLPDVLSECGVHLYADDVQVTFSIPPENIPTGISRLNNELERIYFWASANGLCLNPQKSKCIIICKQSAVTSISGDIVLNGEKIEIVNKTRNLGIIFNNRLTWRDHVDSLVGQLYSKLRALWGAQYFTPLTIRILLAKTYLVPSLLYGCELFANCDSISRRKLNVLFNNIIRYVYGLRRFDHITSVSRNLYGVSFECLLKIRTLIFLHKVIHTQTPKYIFEKIQFFQSPRKQNIVIPRHQYLVSEYQFYIYAARLWNNLPLCQQQNSNANSFKKFLFDFFK